MIKKFTSAFRLLMDEGTDLKKDEDGQILVFTALVGLILVMMVATIFNVGVVVGEKMKVQDAADASAYSQAIWEARILNFIAYTNRAIISHMVTIAFCTGWASHEQLWSRINDFAPTIRAAIPWFGIGPAIATGIEIYYNAVHYANEFFFKHLREFCKYWVKFCPIYQQAVLFELLFTKVLTGSIAKQIGKDIDSKIDINPNTAKIAGSTIPVGIILNLLNFNDLRKVTGFSREEVEFESIKTVLEKTTDGFTRGVSMPREFTVPLPFYPVFEARFGPRGNLKISEDKIEQSENFFVDLCVGCLPWLGCIDCYNVLSIPLVTETEDELKLGEYKWWTYHYPEDEDTPLFPSVYTWARKKSRDLIQIPLFNAHATDDINAFARAEVFYWEPDKNRHQKLSKKTSYAAPGWKNPQEYPPREPNLFNPLWHARLARTDKIFDNLRIPAILEDFLFITH
jgi:hypothetical protein